MDDPASEPPDAPPGRADSAEALEDIRERVVNVVGHALRTPMATLRGQIEVLASTDDPARQEELVATLLWSARRLERLLDDVLVAARIDTRLPADRAQPVEIGGVVSGVWARMAPDRDLELNGRPGTTAEVSREGLEWMLKHVLDNAARYGRGPVTVAVEPTDGRVRIVVSSDPVHPVSDDELANAFELFYRGEGAVMDSTDRLGIGLTVVQRLVEAAGGTVTLGRGDDGTIEATLRLPR